MPRSCVIASNALGTVTEGSLAQLNAGGTLYRAKVKVLGEGAVQLILRDDPCDPTTRPAFVTVAADFSGPTCVLSLHTKPSLANSTFTVLAAFSEPVLPVDPTDVTVSHARVTAVLRLSPRQVLLVAEGVAGATATVQLSSFAFQVRLLVGGRWLAVAGHG